MAPRCVVVASSFSQRVALTRVDIRAPALAMVHRLAGSAPGGSERRLLVLDRRLLPALKPRNNFPVSPLLEATRADLCVADYTARHAARKTVSQAARKSAKWAVAAVAVAVVGGSPRSSVPLGGRDVE